jgi:hypothetical protein
VLGSVVVVVVVVIAAAVAERGVDGESEALRAYTAVCAGELKYKKGGRASAIALNSLECSSFISGNSQNVARQNFCHSASTPPPPAQPRDLKMAFPTRLFLANVCFWFVCITYSPFDLVFKHANKLNGALNFYGDNGEASVIVREDPQVQEFFLAYRGALNTIICSIGFFSGRRGQAMTIVYLAAFFRFVTFGPIMRLLVDEYDSFPENTFDSVGLGGMLGVLIMLNGPNLVDQKKREIKARQEEAKKRKQDERRKEVESSQQTASDIPSVPPPEDFPLTPATATREPAPSSISNVISPGSDATASPSAEQSTTVSTTAATSDASAPVETAKQKAIRESREEQERRQEERIRGLTEGKKKK